MTCLHLTASHCISLQQLKVRIKRRPGMLVWDDGAVIDDGGVQHIIIIVRVFEVGLELAISPTSMQVIPRGHE